MCLPISIKKKLFNSKYNFVFSISTHINMNLIIYLTDI